jgi:hypothetical protein
MMTRAVDALALGEEAMEPGHPTSASRSTSLPTRRDGGFFGYGYVRALPQRP